MKRFFLSLTLLLAILVANAHTPFWHQRASLFEILPVDSTNIVMLGNSLTNGCEWHELLNNPKVINRGISGDIVQGIEDRLEPIVSGHPEKIFLMIGVNDVSHNISADSIATAISTLLSHIRQATPTTKIYLQSCLPFRQEYDMYHALDGKEDVVPQINKQLVCIAKEMQITYIDLYSLFVAEDGLLNRKYTNDGLHLLGPAYLVWRDAIMPYIAE